MRIALDATYSIGGALSGVGNYCREILRGVAAAHTEANFTFCYRPHRFIESFQETLPANARRRLLLEEFPAFSADLLHGLNQRLPRRRMKRSVCTFHDLFVMTSDYSTLEFRERFTRLAREAAARADLIIAVSSFTAHQVEALLGVEPARLRVVHHGVHPPANAPDEALRENIILHVGALQRRKNVTRLISAFEQVPGDWRLVLAGGAGYEAGEIRKCIHASPAAARIEELGFVSQESLHRLYAKARILAFPSLDEGFGIPVLEAMAWGVPVLTSNRSALPEAAGDAALLVDPLDGEAIAGNLRRLACDTGLRVELAAKGKRRAEDFTWPQAVEKTWSVYSELLA